MFDASLLGGDVIEWNHELLRSGVASAYTEAMT